MGRTKTKNLPETLYRLSDGEAFTLNSDGKTYSNLKGKEQFPKNYHAKYDYEYLVVYCGFAENIPEYPPFLYRTDGTAVKLIKGTNCYSDNSNGLKWDINLCLKSGLKPHPPKPVPDVLDKYLYEILVPTTIERNGRVVPIKTRYHRVWDAKVREIAKGLTILQPAKGEWISPDDELFTERMIPVRVYCTEFDMEKIIQLTIEYYAQKAVMAYKISDSVLLRHAAK